MKLCPSQLARKISKPFYWMAFPYRPQERVYWNPNEFINIQRKKEWNKHGRWASLWGNSSFSRKMNKERERERESDLCAYWLRSMGICYSSKCPFFNLWVFTWPYAIHFIPTNMVRTRGNLRMRKQNTKTTVPLDLVPERRTERFPPRFRPVGRFCERRFIYLSSPTGREGEISRPLDHMRQIPFMYSARLIDSTNFYIYIYIEQSSRYLLHVVRSGVY